MSFFTRLNAAVARNRSLLCIGLDPNPEQIPQRYAQPENVIGSIEAWLGTIIHDTHDLVCCYKPNIAFFEALGEPGMALLRRLLQQIPDDIPVLLDAKRGDIGSTATAYAKACFDDLGVDAVTLSPYLGRDSIAPFADYADKGLFVLCHTSNPSAQEFQTLEISDWRTLDRSPNEPLYLHVARTATRWSPNVGLVVGATYPEAMHEVRAAAPHAWFLVPGIGTQGGDLTATLEAGLRADGSGLIISASRGVSLADDHRAAAEAIRTEIEDLRRKIEDSRLTIGETAVRGKPAVAANDDTASAHQTSIFNLQPLFSSLADLGAIKFGDFTLASGARSPFYIDLRLLVSQPAVLSRTAEAYAAILAGLDFDRIAGVPYAALPIGTAVAMAADVPMIYPRKESKGHGLGKDIEGAWEEGDHVVIIEDLITSGGSTIKSAERLRAAGLIVEHAIVLIDREQGGIENLAAAGITAHSVVKLTDALTMLHDAGKLDDEKRTEILAFISGS